MYSLLPNLTSRGIFEWWIKHYLRGFRELAEVTGTVHTLCDPSFCAMMSFFEISGKWMKLLVPYTPCVIHLSVSSSPMVMFYSSYTSFSKGSNLVKANTWGEAQDTSSSIHWIIQEAITGVDGLYHKLTSTIKGSTSPSSRPVTSSKGSATC